MRLNSQYFRAGVWYTYLYKRDFSNKHLRFMEKTDPHGSISKQGVIAERKKEIDLNDGTLPIKPHKLILC